MLVTVCARAREVPLERCQLAHSVDVVPLPTVRSAASACTAYLIREELCDSAADAVVVWLDDSRPSVFVEELDETLFLYRRHKLRIHYVHPTNLGGLHRPVKHIRTRSRIPGLVSYRGYVLRKPLGASP